MTTAATSSSSAHRQVLFSRDARTFQPALMLTGLLTALLLLGLNKAFPLQPLGSAVIRGDAPVIISMMVAYAIGMLGTFVWVGIDGSRGYRVQVFSDGTVEMRFVFGLGWSRTWTGRAQDIERIGIRREEGDVEVVDGELKTPYVDAHWVDLPGYRYLWLAGNWKQGEFASFGAALGLPTDTIYTQGEKVRGLSFFKLRHLGRCASAR